MKKILLLFLVSFVALSSFSQNTSKYTELQKFSYLLIGITNGVPTTESTAFFLKKNNKIYLVSAYHSFSSWDGYNGKKMLPINDTIRIRIVDKKTKNIVFMPFNVKKIVDGSTHIFYYRTPDVYMLELSNPKELTLYDINIIDDDKLVYDKRNGIPNRVIFYGFNNGILKIKHIGDFKTVKSILSTGKMIGNMNQKRQIFDLQSRSIFIDSLNYKTTNKGAEGDSGSPVFFEYLNKKTGKAFFTFGGIVSVGDAPSGTLLMVKPTQVMPPLK